MPRSALSVLFPPVLFATLVLGVDSQTQPRRGIGRDVAAPPHLVEVGPGDSAWYPFAERPPFRSAEAADEALADQIHAGNALVVPGLPPSIPAQLEKPLFREGRFVPGYFIVHFEDALRPRDKALLDQLTGPVRRADGTPLVRWYLPDNALVAWIPGADVLAALEEADRVDWVGRFQPAYKLDPRIGTVPLTSPDRVGRALFRLDLDLVPGHPLDDVVGAVERAGATVLERTELRGLKGYDVRFVTVDAVPALVTELAKIEGVRNVQERGDGVLLHDLSGGGKLQAGTLGQDDGSASPIVTAANFPLWVTHDLQGQGQLIGVVDTSLDWNNIGSSGCAYGYPSASITNYGFAPPNMASLLITSVGPGGVNLKVPRADLLGGATLLGVAGNEHGCAVAGAALADFYGNDDTTWWEHDVDAWES